MFDNISLNNSSNISTTGLSVPGNTEMLCVRSVRSHIMGILGDIDYNSCYIHSVI